MRKSPAARLRRVRPTDRTSAVLVLTELSAVVKCSTVMVTTTVCSRTASSSRTPSFGPEPVMTTEPPSGTPVPVPRLPVTRRTMAERLDSLTFTLPAGRRRRRRRRGRPDLENKNAVPLPSETLLFHSCAGKTQIAAEFIVGRSVSLLQITAQTEEQKHSFSQQSMMGNHGFKTHSSLKSHD